MGSPQVELVSRWCAMPGDVLCWRGVAFTLIGVFAVIFAPRATWADEPNANEAIVVDSPGGTIRVLFALRDFGEENGVPTYRVLLRGKTLVEDSRLGLDFARSGPFRRNLQIAAVKRREHDQTYRLAVGKSSSARDCYREAVVVLEESAEPKRRLELTLRAYEDGAAFRYRVPKQPALAKFTITEEHSQFAIPGDAVAYALPLGSFTTPYEAYYNVTSLQKIKPDSLLGMPLLLKHPGGAWLALSEANLTDYAGMYLVRLERGSEDDRKRSVLVSRLSPWPGHPDVKVKATAPHSSPWRVIMIADEPGRLIESNLIVNLNEPCAIADTTWIKPGKISFLWWNGYVAKGVGFEGGLNTATLKHYVDFCAEHGIEYCSLDGFQGAWYGGPIRPTEPVDVTTAVPEIDLPEVLRYARANGVRIRAWVHWEALKPQLDKALATYEKWGLEGVMVDFMDRDDQEMVNWYRDVVEKAARHHLTVNFHGAYKPTGLRRTYPNLLTREGVLNLEYNKFPGSRGVMPEHEMIVPFTRMLAGPLDFHQGGFRHVTPSKFKPRNIAPLVVGTRARALASYVVLENHLPMVADYPAAYRGQTGIEFVASVPTTWDETRVLCAAVGDYITIARRSGQVWYVGSMTDGAPRQLSIPLRFLPKGTFTAEIYQDDSDAPNSPSRVIRQQTSVTSADEIAIKMSPAGGHVIRLSPKPGPP